MDKLAELRKRIDEIDTGILELFFERMEVVSGIADVKKEIGMKVFDEKREDEILERRVKDIENESIKRLTKSFLQDLMDVSKEYQWERNNSAVKEKNNKKVGFLGVEGSFTHNAAKEYFGNSIFKSLETFEEIFEAVINDKVTHGILPIENTSTGSIIEVYDLLKKYNLNIVGEKNIEISQFLLAKKGVELSDITTVYSHPQALKQSKEFLDNYDWKLVNSENTSGSVKKVSESDRKDIAAIGSYEAAQLYGLNVLQNNINYNEKNITRFIVVTKEENDVKNADKITLGFSVEHKPGALYNVLGIFSDAEVNLYKLESRPILNLPFEYYFYADVQGNLDDENVKAVIDIVKTNSTSLRIYGNYMRDKRR